MADSQYTDISELLQAYVQKEKKEGEIMQEVKANGVKNVTGSVRPRPSKENVKYYDVILELGRDPYTGKRKRVSFRAETTDRNEAENILTIKKAEYL